MIKNLLLIAFIGFGYPIASAQFVARMEVADSLPGICDAKNVYVLFPSFAGQKDAICPVSKEELQMRLNNEVPFLKENLKLNMKGTISIIINCNGTLSEFGFSAKPVKPQLVEEARRVFTSLGTWKPGLLDEIAVDSQQFFNVRIKKGVLILE